MSTSGDGKLRAGQRWHYRTRPGEERSTIVIVKIDIEHDHTTIVHVSIDDLRIRNPRAPDGFAHEVGHMPLSEAAVLGSVTTLIESDVHRTSWQEGYRMWREAFEAGKGGFFTGSITEGLEVIEKVLDP